MSGDRKVILREATQTPKDKDRMFSLVCGC